MKEKVEYLLTGAVLEDTAIYTVCKNIRQWPVHTGSGCYSITVYDKRVMSFIDAVVLRLRRLGFSGAIDIEFFGCEDAFYINEINWRSSGRNHVGLFTKTFPTYQYYLSVTGQPLLQQQIMQKPALIMNEGVDIRNALVDKNISILKWFFQLIRTKNYAFWFSKDLKPAFARYRYYFKKFTSRSE